MPPFLTARHGIAALGSRTCEAPWLKQDSFELAGCDPWPQLLTVTGLHTDHRHLHTDVLKAVQLLLWCIVAVMGDFATQARLAGLSFKLSCPLAPPALQSNMAQGLRARELGFSSPSHMQTKCASLSAGGL